jgi:hypothetical protein
MSEVSIPRTAQTGHLTAGRYRTRREGPKVVQGVGLEVGVGGSVQKETETSHVNC